MRTIYKQCSLCGKDYPACSYCESQKEFLAWRSVACSHEHFLAYATLVNYRNKQISKEEAKEKLLTIEDNYGKLTYTPTNEGIANEILKEEESQIEDTRPIKVGKSPRRKSSK